MSVLIDVLTATDLIITMIEKFRSMGIDVTVDNISQRLEEVKAEKDKLMEELNK